MIPMLNPDGENITYYYVIGFRKMSMVWRVIKSYNFFPSPRMFNGHYRTDTTQGNRVYLDPSPELHPSIFTSCFTTTTSSPPSRRGRMSHHISSWAGTKLLSISDRGRVYSSFGNGLSSWCGRHEAVSQHIHVVLAIAPHSDERTACQDWRYGYYMYQ